MIYYSPSVKQMKDRTKKPWRATVYYVDEETGVKKQKTKVIRDAKGKKDAEKIAREWCDELNKEIKKENEDFKTKKIQPIIEEYEDMLLNLNRIEQSTYYKDLSISKNYIYPYIGNNVFCEVNREQIQDWITVLFSKGLSPKTVRNAYAQLKKIYTYYYEIEKIEDIPFKGIKISGGTEKKKTHLEKEQMNQFLSAVGNEYKNTDPMFCGCYLACYAGLRRGEICGLRWRNIDFEKEEITIDSAIGVAIGGNYTKPPKNRSSIRKVPIVPQLLEILKIRYDYVKPESNWFVIGDRNNFMSLQSFTNKFALLVDEYDLKDYYGERITPHGLRHNFATVGIRSGADIASISLIMGHASRSMTLDTYGDASPDAIKKATEKLALRFDDDTDLSADGETADRLYAIEQKLKDENN